MLGSTSRLSKAVTLTYHPRGAARDLFLCRDPEIVLSGPSGTGKSRACLEKVHLCACKYAGMRALMVRKTLRSLVGAGIVTFKDKILHPLDGVSFFGGSSLEPPHFSYPNGSKVMVGGLDNAAKIMSSEYDLVYVQEATDVTEADWESITTRLRNGVLPYQQLIGDCNPGAPTHWLRQRADKGATLMLESRHSDNPTVTSAYQAILDSLTGVRRLRLRDGLWAAAEGLVYPAWDRAVHLVDRFAIPTEWRRIRAIDFGYTNPFVCQWWALDGDGRMYLYRELYHTQRLVSQHAAQINALSAGETYDATVADHDAEDRATLQSHGITTAAAYKAVSTGIQALEQRLQHAGDGKPRLFVLRDSLVERDAGLMDRKRPYCTEQEFDSYAWPVGTDGKPKKEEPVKMDDHGMDTARYAVAYVDHVGLSLPYQGAGWDEEDTT